MKTILLLMCLSACTSSFELVKYKGDSSLHIACDVPIQCAKRAQRECPWGYDLKFHGQTGAYYQIAVRCK